MKTLTKHGVVIETHEKATLLDAMNFFIKHGNISVEHEDAIFFIDAMRKHHKKTKIEVRTSDNPKMTKFIKL